MRWSTPRPSGKDGPAIIIEESDGSLDHLLRAIELGYRGTSADKNCKGIVKGLANAALLKKHVLTHLSGEDLANAGPVALLQDLSVTASARRAACGAQWPTLLLRPVRRTRRRCSDTPLVSCRTV